MPVSRDQLIETLVQRHRQALTAAAYHLCGDWEAARDLAQETFVDAYRGLDGLRDPQKAGAWLFAILRRKTLAHRRLRRHETELTIDPAVPAPDDAESMIRGIVVEQVAKLPREDREILAGKYLLGLSYQELAEALQINEGAIRVRCFRAKEKLREVLSGEGVRVPRRGEKHGM